MIATGSQELGLNIIDVKSKNVDFSTTHTLMSWLEGFLMPGIGYQN